MGSDCISSLVLLIFFTFNSMHCFSNMDRSVTTKVLIAQTGLNPVLFIYIQSLATGFEI